MGKKSENVKWIIYSIIGGVIVFVIFYTRPLPVAYITDENETANIFGKLVAATNGWYENFDGRHKKFIENTKNSSSQFPSRSIYA